MTVTTVTLLTVGFQLRIDHHHVEVDSSYLLG